ncbi:hypothetical protein C2E23DRAFT_823906 [Lenzites betulinus]|nr:hypothetical protein C2E23DRAFT_823906 [Lenzites betulinus]
MYVLANSIARLRLVMLGASMSAMSIDALRLSYDHSATARPTSVSPCRILSNHILRTRLYLPIRYAQPVVRI